MHKTTDLDNFTPNDGGLFNECPWRFGDTLTFTARLSDVLRPGLIRAEKDFHLGPLQLDFSKAAEVGIAGVDLKRCVLPACVCSPCSSEDSRWENPPIVVPLYHVHGCLRADGQVLGQPVGHVILSFTVDQDPEATGCSIRENRYESNFRLYVVFSRNGQPAMMATEVSSDEGDRTPWRHDGNGRP